MNRFFIAVALSVFSFTFSLSSEAAVTKYMKLSDRRAEIRFPEMTREDRELVLRQANLLLRELYVHREHKIALYGTAIDPIPMLDRLQADYVSLTSEQFHYRMSQIFTSQRDLHTNYYFPKPIQCYASMLPFDFTLVKDGVRGGLKIAVKRVLNDRDMLRLAPEMQLIGVGDQLVEYNGKPAFEAVRDFYDAGNGSNEHARLRYGVFSMAFLGHRLDPIPTNDTVILRLKRAGSGSTYAVEIPWISRATESCLNPAPRPGGSFDVATNGNEKLLEKERIFRERLKLQKRTRRQEEAAFLPTAEPILTFKMLQTPAGKFGLVGLRSFVPEKLSDAQTVLELRRLLETEFKDTDGLIFDVRDNGGGSLWLADRLVQLFVPLDIQGSLAKLLSSPANRFLLSHPGVADPAFGEALTRAQASGASLTDPVLMTPNRITNDIGQSYFKPVAVLTNSSCYSACDTFTAQMQDQGGAVIFGEDGATGGGGANVWNWTNFLSALPENDRDRFEPLKNGQDMRTAWRQSVRVGRNAGRLIEDFGVTPDRLNPPVVQDLTDESVVQFTTIGDHLKSLAAGYEGRVDLFTNDGAVNLFPGDFVKVPGVATGTDRIEFYMNDQLLGSQPIDESGSRLEFTAPNFHVGAPGTYGRVKLVGMKGAKRVWRKFVDFRSIPPYRAFAAGETIVADFAATIQANGLTLFTKNVPLSEGWNIAGGLIRVGDGTRYVDNVDSEISYFLDLSARSSAQLKFTAEVHTEKDYDFFTVSVVSDGKTKVLGQPLHGDVARTDYSFDLSEFAGQRIEIRFAFLSDSGVVGKGVEMTHLSVE